MTDRAFEASIEPYRRELHAHCYRMLGSVADADDALQDTLVAAWRAFATFEGRGTLRAWLYAIATRASLALLDKRKGRALSIDRGPSTDGIELDAMNLEPIWLEPYPAIDPLIHRESLELAFVAALHHLPPNQRAVILLRDVVELTAEETAAQLDTSVASVTSALQRARATLAQHAPHRSQDALLAKLGDATIRTLVTTFVDAFERGDVPALLALLARDAKFSMPPIPNWFHGHDAIGRFLRERVFATPWRLTPTARVSGQLAIVARQSPAWQIGALQILTLAEDGAISEITAFLDPAIHRLVLPAAALSPA